MLPGDAAYPGLAVQRAEDEEQLPHAQGEEGCHCREEEDASLMHLISLLMYLLHCFLVRSVTIYFVVGTCRIKNTKDNC